MKTQLIQFKWQLLLTCFILSFINPPHSFAQQANTVELIIHLENFNFEKQGDQFILKTSLFPAVQVVGYCAKLEVMMLRINRDKQSSDDRFFDELKISGYRFIIKKDATIQKVMDTCGVLKDDLIQE